MVIKITPNEKGNPPGKLAEAELHFTEGPLEGLKLIGFSVWERRSGNGRNVTFPPASTSSTASGAASRCCGRPPTPRRRIGCATWCCRPMPSTKPSSRPSRSEAGAATSRRTHGLAPAEAGWRGGRTYGPPVVVLVMRRRRSRAHGCYHVFCGRRRRWRLALVLPPHERRHVERRPSSKPSMI